MGSRGVFQPVGQKRLTNIAVVRLKKAGQRFEIACYQNKVRDWRSGIEKDLDEVLQATTVYHNVSKGVLATHKELQEAFGTTDMKAICLEILVKGDLQVADKERKMEYDNLFKDVASVLAEKCVNPDTNRPYTISMLERALRDVHFNLDPKKSAKQQALEALPILQEKFPIQRARMRLRLTAPESKKAALMEMVDSYAIVIESTEHNSSSSTAVVQTDPANFREIHNRMQSEVGGKGRVEVVTMAVMAEGATPDEFALSRSAPAPAPSVHEAHAVGVPPPPAAVHHTAPAQSAPSASGGADAGAAAAPRPASSARAGAGAVSTSGGGGGADVVYPRGPIAELPEAHASRKERFAELDTLQAGWEVELRNKGSTVEAVFYAPNGEKVGAFANARRMALAAHKAANA
mmetsp:Transcript_13793/g.29761  ORF Transcript_13793/g.29761 Transcript_13793/m.29761 type:complete len:405 (+) Transcript_13793:177-1391(+)|eukprot:CAMPEP_0202902500 /NCGR_PEP_ID=MMETSP1392-20130828/16887_1 /ASSEMBLY_ACC=CAM_ASM_000868 /TAXON_ID=225041 /ORGANISM="Chlamydomonas chlamydogama, Strain SAG 11-48b" /LENGTH=404 /DNA_ID=CAMNT_0049589273 /DNA_START=174 /DNA_END=1388 /DNA_ORIENTATION=-